MSQSLDLYCGTGVSFVAFPVLLSVLKLSLLVLADVAVEMPIFLEQRLIDTRNDNA